MEQKSVGLRIRMSCVRRVLISGWESCVAEDLHVWTAGSYMNHYWAACCPIDSKPNASKTNVFIHSNTFWFRSLKKNPPFERGRASMCQSGWVSSVNVIKIRQNNSMKVVVVGGFFLFALHLPSNSAKMSREKFMWVIIWQQKPLFCFHVKLVKFQSLLSSVCASLWLSTAGTLLQVGLQGERRGRRPQEDCGSLVFI